MAEHMTKAEWKRRRKRKRMIKRYSIIGTFALIVILVLILLIKFISFLFSGNEGIIKKAGSHKIKEQLFTVSDNNRPGQKMDSVKGIVIHNTGEAGASAKFMWDYYENLSKNKSAAESVHFLVDTDGTILQCIPCDEIAFHAKGRNSDSIGIQYCYTNSEGKMNDKTYEAMADLVARLIKEYDLTISDVVLHYDVTGRLGPEYYAENSESWQNFLKDVSKKL